MKPLTSEEWATLMRLSIDMVDVSNRQIRLGQAHMNVLHEIRPELYKAIVATEFDCFYNDEKIPQFMQYLNDLDR